MCIKRLVNILVCADRYSYKIPKQKTITKHTNKLSVIQHPIECSKYPKSTSNQTQTGKSTKNSNISMYISEVLTREKMFQTQNKQTTRKKTETWCNMTTY